MVHRPITSPRLFSKCTHPIIPDQLALCKLTLASAVAGASIFWVAVCFITHDSTVFRTALAALLRACYSHTYARSPLACVHGKYIIKWYVIGWSSSSESSTQCISSFLMRSLQDMSTHNIHYELHQFSYSSFVCLF